jgi:uncharacterized membrane protein
MTQPFSILIPSGIFILLDIVFLYINAKTFENQIRQVQNTSLNMRYNSAIVCYIFLIGALYYFILREHKTPNEAFLLGIAIYGVYETTTYATLEKWRLETVAKDTLWGGILFYLTTYLTYKIGEIKK